MLFVSFLLNSHAVCLVDSCYHILEVNCISFSLYFFSFAFFFIDCVTFWFGKGCKYKHGCCY
ncbi:hypothetical protein HanRHA438_Chr12g0557841 [Helianthus annuus]|uniref:Uncharacterized protein n=1 Tax=Helianthus annuus TaxID=4232 RepID=A0A251T2X9_HELAN|nr:hypothetical protein HanXRQr2_Chr12g0546521 [Helianthus annuus]KAJ0489771.1 hypothetical protein HanHA300_Chr12g0447761 [Helianthus annuus]KAJ0505686.1 hypothetical protein HanHA89_Chr12g0473271 [Helianthus annuus]KAJ0675355.1 hypothetical protein HanLR1_Chr12g0450211 [Helianthus annuus]KAJ0863107.1 hypothetical protein HanPSC8_Chr12g0526081 [Helianthus annuus]